MIRRVMDALPLVIALLALSGCASNGRRLFTSRWAMDDEGYAARYSAPYGDDKLEKWSRMGQQFVDAHFQAGKTGLYVNGGLATKHRVALGGEVGVFHLPQSWATTRVGFIGLLAEGLPNYLVGGVLGVRFHAPTRLSPYVGLAGMAGYSKNTTTADHSYVDGNGSLVVEGQTIPGPGAGMAAIIPEIGLSWWMNSHVRAGLGASYYFTTDGRDQDFLLLGMTFDFAEWNSPGSHVHTASPELKQILESEPYFKSEQERAARESVVPVFDEAPFSEVFQFQEVSSPLAPPRLDEPSASDKESK